MRISIIRMMAGVSAAVLATGGVALAADISEPIPAAPIADPYVAPTTFDWNGPYVGAYGAYGFGSYDVSNADGSRDIDVDGFTGGIYGGYNYMVTPNVVVGAEADLGLGDDAKFRFQGTDVKADSSVAGSVRGRVGYAFDNVMVYGTTGVAIAGGEAKFNGGKDENTHVGWVVGGGVEAALTENITARAEYTYTDMSEETYTVAGESAKADLDGSLIKVGVGYKF
ncbi:outer membrane protein [Methylobrevis pamukkalensis]|uniref:Outer membrane protein A n=1 Tax=Methylobrevis pamukkalensis TaxID=1439726 RepID=A0A1E3H588_9HYPH|nr:outer membrane beta-barrel protein [Methylobrevis pamukkalensis]ODN71470.1 outer membrane protein A [Methylobrevis pamukkalensis]